MFGLGRVTVSVREKTIHFELGSVVVGILIGFMLGIILSWGRVFNVYEYDCL